MSPPQKPLPFKINAMNEKSTHSAPSFTWHSPCCCNKTSLIGILEAHAMYCSSIDSGEPPESSKKVQTYGRGIGCQK